MCYICIKIRNMIRYTFLLFILIVLSCSEKKASAPDVVTNTDTVQTQVAAVKDSVAVIDLTDAAQFLGKKPSEVGLFDQYNLKQRFKKLLGSEYETFIKDWNTESVIKKDEEILYFSACRANACDQNKYLVILDMADNNINIINIQNGRPRSFENKQIIGMSGNLLAEFERIKDSKGL